MSESYESLRRLFSEAGYGFVEPAMLYEASVFVDLAGEDLRRRLFLTSGPDGTEMTLRPDYTIPVCLHHLARGAAKRRADYAYLGPVFRQRRDEPGEFFQAGVESLGRADRAAADADLLKLALAAVDLLGVRQPVVRIGDSALFAAVLGALEVNEPWRRRLARAFGDTARLTALLKRLAAGGDPLPATDGVLAGLDMHDEAGIAATVGEMLARSGLATVGGRGAAEIAARFVEKVALAEGDRRAPRVLGKFLRIAGEPRKAAAALRKLADVEQLAIGAAIDTFEERADGFAAHGIELRRLSFDAEFGRRLDYYTGFVFEIYARAGERPIVGGGRYDKLLGLVSRGAKGGGGAIPAVGFSIWLDRIGGGA